MTLLHETAHAEFFRITPNILKVIITTESIDEHILSHIWTERDKVAERFNLTELINSHAVTYKMNRTAQRMSFEKEAIGNFNSIAIINKNPIMTLFVNIFMRISPFHIPIKSFSDVENAVYWIRSANSKTVLTKQSA